VHALFEESYINADILIRQFLVRKDMDVNEHEGLFDVVL